VLLLFSDNEIEFFEKISVQGEIFGSLGFTGVLPNQNYA